MDEKQIKFNLGLILRRNGLTQRQASQLTGISENGISKLTGSGVRQIRLDTIFALCQGLEVTPAQLITIEEKQPAGEK